MLLLVKCNLLSGLPPLARFIPKPLAPLNRVTSKTWPLAETKEIIVDYQMTSCESGSSFKYVHKIFWKTNISDPLIRTRTCAYQGGKNVCFRKILRTYLMDDPIQIILLHFSEVTDRGMHIFSSINKQNSLALITSYITQKDKVFL